MRRSCSYVCMHAGLTLIPVTIIAVQDRFRSTKPTDIFIPCMIATFAATMAAMSIVSFKQKINIFQPVILAWIGGYLGIDSLAWFICYHNNDVSQAADHFQVF